MINLPARSSMLLATVRELDVTTMSTGQISAICRDRVPDATPDEVADALRVAAGEQADYAAEMQAARDHLAPIWREDPEMTLEEAIVAMADTGDEKASAWRDRLRE